MLSTAAHLRALGRLLEQHYASTATTGALLNLLAVEVQAVLACPHVMIARANAPVSSAGPPDAPLSCVAQAGGLPAASLAPHALRTVLLPLPSPRAAAQSYLVLLLDPSAPSLDPEIYAALNDLLRHAGLLLAYAQQADQQRELAAQARRSAEQLAVLTLLARIASLPLHPEEILTAVVERLCSGGNYPHAAILLLDEATAELVMVAQAGGPLSPRQRRQAVQAGILGRAVRTRQVQRVANVNADPDYVPRAAATRALLCVPIIASGRVLGVLSLEASTPAYYGPDDVALVDAAADIVAGVLESARLHRRDQEAAVLEERNRLARELHDSVTQQIFSLTLTARAAQAHLHANPQRTASLLERVQETAAAALAEMRALIAQLRPPDLGDKGLVLALRQHSVAISRREGLRIDFSVTGADRLARGAEHALYRIVQEALTNVVKHAQAQHVHIRLEFTPQHVLLCVHDDGQGFTPQAAPPAASGRHLGLLTMHERATEMGAVLTVDSAPGRGTEITVRLERLPGTLT